MRSSAIFNGTGIALFLLLLGVTGCNSVGPSTLSRDRLHYSCALSDSWKEQLLVNIVKTRYEDTPAFLEVVSVVSGYTVELGAGVSGQYSPLNQRGDTFYGGGVSGKFTDRPTISYAPVSGEKFARSLMSPVPVEAVWSVLQSGVPADFLLGLTLQSMGGHYNLGIYAGRLQQMDPDFGRMLQLLSMLQDAHAFDSEIRKEPDGFEIWVQFPSTGSFPEAVLSEAAELKQLLNVSSQTNRVRVSFGTVRADPGALAVRTRSLMQILSTLGAGVEIPARHAAAGHVEQIGSSRLPLSFKVKSAKAKPNEAFVAVPYDGYWYWVEREDLESKKTLAAVTLLMHFLESGAGKSTPILTIPVN